MDGVVDGPLKYVFVHDVDARLLSPPCPIPPSTLGSHIFWVKLRGLSLENLNTYQYLGSAQQPGLPVITLDDFLVDDFGRQLPGDSDQE